MLHTLYVEVTEYLVGVGFFPKIELCLVGSVFTYCYAVSLALRSFMFVCF